MLSECGTRNAAIGTQFYSVLVTSAHDYWPDFADIIE
jgi:hypothetical protein